MQVVFSLFSLLFSMLQACFDMLISTLRYAHQHVSRCSLHVFVVSLNDGLSKLLHPAPQLVGRRFLAALFLLFLFGQTLLFFLLLAFEAFFLLFLYACLFFGLALLLLVAHDAGSCASCCCGVVYVAEEVAVDVAAGTVFIAFGEDAEDGVHRAVVRYEVGDVGVDAEVHKLGGVYLVDVCEATERLLYVLEV